MLSEKVIAKLVVILHGGAFMPFIMPYEVCLSSVDAIKGIIEKRNLKEAFPLIFFGNDSNQKMSACIDTQWIIGAYITELGNDYQKEYLKNQKDMKDMLEKHLGGGEEWKG